MHWWFSHWNIYATKPTICVWGTMQSIQSALQMFFPWVKSSDLSECQSNFSKFLTKLNDQKKHMMWTWGINPGMHFQTRCSHQCFNEGNDCWPQAVLGPEENNIAEDFSQCWDQFQCSWQQLCNNHRKVNCKSQGQVALVVIRHIHLCISLSACCCKECPEIASHGILVCSSISSSTESPRVTTFRWTIERRRSGNRFLFWISCAQGQPTAKLFPGAIWSI